MADSFEAQSLSPSPPAGRAAEASEAPAARPPASAPASNVSSMARPNGNSHGQFGWERLSSLNNGGRALLPYVGGSGARVPTQFLDHKGSFLHRQAEAGPSRPRELPTTFDARSAAQLGQPKRESASIDLTEDDGDDVSIVRAAGPSMPADQDQDVCIGQVNCVVLAMFGVPEEYIADPSITRAEDYNKDPIYHREGWPLGYDYYLEPGYRPVEISWQGGRAPVSAHSVVPPLTNHRISGGAGGFGPSVGKIWGNVADKYNRALLPLLSQRKMRFSGRMQLIQRNKALTFLHVVELLCFIPRRQAKEASDFLYANNVALETPRLYSPSWFAKTPPLEVREYQVHRAPGPGRPPGSQVGMGQYRGTIIQQKEATEEEKRKQVDSVYASLPDGENLEQIEPDQRIGTPLLPHQKQALAFLQERERLRTFDENANEGSASNGSSSSGSPIISLWKKTRKGVTISYENVVTQGEQMRRPEICRGAILADDMGLGKTLVAIGLIASSMDEAKDFQRKKGPVHTPEPDLPPKAGPSTAGNGSQAEGSDSEDDVTISDFTINVHGAPPAKKPRLGGRPQEKGKKKGKRELAREQAQKERIEQLKGRTRATLVVLPLTLVSAWEGQIREHWNPDAALPKIYVHHGPNRETSWRKISNHDIVLTTYSTLASEYSLLTADEEDSDDDGQESEDITLVDEEGNDIQPRTAAEKAALIRKQDKLKKKRAKLAKRKRRGGGQDVAPLQQIKWFRIILDEAHTIKEASTLQSRAVCHLIGSRRLALTGTPVQNRIDDLYSLIRFLKLEPFDDRGVWNKFCGAKEKAGTLRAPRRTNAADGKNAEPLDAMALARVQTIMKFLTLRRTKDMPGINGVGKLLDLPPKFSRIVKLQFDDRERATYKAMQQRYVDEFKQRKADDTLKYNYATILHEISNLRMTCDHMELVDASVDAKRRRELATANGMEENDAGVDDPYLAIKRHGLSRQRAVRYFDLLSSSDAAHCVICNEDLADFVNNELDEDAVKKPVITKCLHFFCDSCFNERAGSSNINVDNDELRVGCPECGATLNPLTEVQKLSAGDVEGSSGDDMASALALDKFGCDLQTPLSKRSDYSTKIRALVEELETFSRSNPASRLYDPSAPFLEQVAAPEGESSTNGEIKDSVIVRQAADTDVKNSQPIKSIVFSQWTKMLDRVARAVHRSGIKAAHLDGRMHRQARSENLEAFRTDPATEVLLVSLKAGGVGLNLISACRAYLMEPYWNPATENQGLDRIHRMGQLRPVVMTKYIMGESIEENMLELQKRKLQLAESVGSKRRTAMQRDEELGILLGMSQPKNGSGPGENNTVARDGDANQKSNSNGVDASTSNGVEASTSNGVETSRSNGAA